MSRIFGEERMRGGLVMEAIEVSRRSILKTAAAAAKSLARQMSQAWIHFARPGNPNYEGIPKGDR